MSGESYSLATRRRRIRRKILRIVIGAATCGAPFFGPAARAADWSNATLFNGERTGVLGDPGFLNNWGGPFLPGSGTTIVRDTSVAHSGTASLRANLGVVTEGASRFFQTFSSDLASQSARQTRDLTRYDSFEGYVRNDTGTALNLRYEIKDYRDTDAHRASFTIPIPAGSGWTKIAAPLDLAAPNWVVNGSPDLSRTYINSFVFSPQVGTATGLVFVDDFTLHEAAAALDPQTAPIGQLATRLAERQFSGLWSARNRTSGLIYNTSDQTADAALNTTAGVLWMLPSAVRRGWVDQADADVMVSQVVASLNTNRNLTTYLPTRFLNAVTAVRAGGNEESSIDAAFIALALHRYGSLAGTSPALAASVDAIENRFNLKAFVSPASGSTPARWTKAYMPSSGFFGGTYDGYTNEGKVVSLAAEANDAFHVPLQELWNGDSLRARDYLVNAADAHLVHSSSDFRAPFEQALLNLFVDVSDRGVDNYPTRTLATNPWENFVRYEREIAAKLDELERPNFFQPDAGQGGTPGYRQYSMYEDFGQSTLFMPWSVSLALLAGAPGSDEALRTLMSTDLLNGPLGLADSARWANGAASPSNVPGLQDNWNMVLSTMALLDYLDGADSGSRFFASLPQISDALDQVFHDGDVTGNGIVDLADFAIIAANFGDVAGATPASGDADGDGSVDGQDLLRWQRGFSVGAARTVPEPTLEASALVVGLGFRLLKRLSERPVQMRAHKNPQDD